MMSSNDFYVVFQGASPGIYHTWPECYAQVNGYPGAKYRKYSSREEAEKAYREGPGDYYKRGRVESGVNEGDLIGHRPPLFFLRPFVTALCVHVHQRKGKMEYVYDWNSKEGTKGYQRYTKDCPVAGLSQELGEFDALVNGLIFLSTKKIGYAIYTESDTAMTYLEHFKDQPFLNERDQVIVQSDPEIWKLIQRKVNWLRYNPTHNIVRKWETHEWGPSPAAISKR